MESQLDLINKAFELNKEFRKSENLSFFNNAKKSIENLRLEIKDIQFSPYSKSIYVILEIGKIRISDHKLTAISNRFTRCSKEAKHTVLELITESGEFSLDKNDLDKILVNQEKRKSFELERGY